MFYKSKLRFSYQILICTNCTVTPDNISEIYGIKDCFKIIWQKYYTTFPYNRVLIYIRLPVNLMWIIQVPILIVIENYDCFLIDIVSNDKRASKTLCPLSFSNLNVNIRYVMLLYNHTIRTGINFNFSLI